MSLALIQESAREVRRLAIAGSPLAVGDFRLKKFIAPLEQAGAKVPVFAQVAKAISDLVTGTEADSAANLLNLSTLLNAILYTQGQTAADGDYRELELHTPDCVSTRTAARVLKPLVEALTTSGGGRFEIVKAAVERGAFNDLRLVEPSIQALDDTFPELAELVTDKVLPAYGVGIAPLLKRKLELKGKKSDARRLRLLHRLDPDAALDLCKAALDEGSPEVKVAALACLGKHPDCLPLLMEQAKSKNKALRAAALEALAEHDRPEIVTLFTELIKGKALDILARPLQLMRNPDVLRSLLAEGKRLFDSLLKGDEPSLPRHSEVLSCLTGRKDAEVEAFLLACFSQCDGLLKLKGPKDTFVTGADLMETMASLLYDIGSPQALDAVLSKREVLPPSAFRQVLGSAFRAWSAERVYDEFSALLAQKRGAGKERNETLQNTLCAAAPDSLTHTTEESEAETSESQASVKVTLDPRWLDAAIKADLPDLVCRLARPDHPAAVAYLLKQLEPRKQSQAGLVIEGLARCRYPNITNVFLELVAKKAKGAHYFDYDLQMLFSSARHLPPADLPKLDAFGAKLDEKFVDRFLEALAPLRPQPNP